MRKRIGMILDNEFTGDPRVENEVIALQNAGHQVFVLCFDHGGKEQIEDFHGAKIIRTKISLWLKKKLKGLNNTLINIYPYYWKKHIQSFAHKYEIDVLHVHDLWLLEAGLLANKKLKLSIVADLHENFVHAIKHYKYSTTFPGNLIISHSKWARKEIEWLRQVDKIIVVIEEAKERLVNLGIPENKIIVVANYVNISEYTKENIDLTTELETEYSRFKSVVYTGGFDKHRGLEVLIKAVPTVLKAVPDFKLILVGGGSNEAELREVTKDLAIEKYVDFPGYLPHDSLVSYVKISNACAIPHLKNEHTDNTIPHKLFQYMLMEKPVVASNCKPIERILNETRAGIPYKFNDESACAKAIVTLLTKTENEMGKKGKKAVIDKYNWKSTSRELVELYNN